MTIKLNIRILHFLGYSPARGLPSAHSFAASEAYKILTLEDCNAEQFVI
jgi:hypothetical protein